MSQRLLVIEDDPEMRTALLETLEEIEVEVKGVGSTDEALKVAAEFRPNLLVTDVRLPGRDGIEALAELKATFPECVGLVITGYADESAQDRAVQHKAWDYLYKPFHMDEFLGCVQRMMDRHQESREVVETGDEIHEGLALKLGENEFERKRLEAFQAFYVGVRSQALTNEEARHLWDRLEEHEVDLQLATNEEALRTLLQAWEEVIQVAANFTWLGGASLLPPRTSTEAPPKALFDTLIANVKAGKVGGHQRLSLAPLVRRLPPDVREREPRFKSLYDSFWSAA